MMDTILFTVVWNLLIALPVVGVLRAARFHLRRKLVIGRLFNAVGFTVLLMLVLKAVAFWIDGLTGAGSRMYFECRLSEILRQNNVEPFNMIYLDVDNVKDINDRYGHLARNEALKTLASVIKSVLCRTETISRLGGDEFGILVQVETQANLDTVARKMERALEAVLQQVDELMYHCKKDKKTMDQEL